MKILIAMTYFRPYVSGPIIYVENLARELVQRGHEVTVLTSQYDPGLAREETLQSGTQVVRVPVLFRISKGVIMPTFAATATRLIQEHDVVAIQVPQAETPILAALASQLGIPATMTYHCDVQLPKGLFNRVVDRVVLAGNYASARLVNNIIAYTSDYAQHSPLMSRFLEKVVVIPPPVDMPPPRPAMLESFRTRYGLEGKRVIGICGRFATEKGFEHLIGSIPLLLEEFPNLVVLHAGEFENVIGEQEYRDRLRPMLERYREQWVPLGVLGGEELAAFFAACDVTVLPSLNRTESFGFVQIESMLNGTPVVASNLPGVRVPVQTMGMGLIAPIGDTKALASALAEVLRRPSEFQAPREEVEAEFSAYRTANDYERLYRRLLDEAKTRTRRKSPLRWMVHGGALLLTLFAFVVTLFLPKMRD
ncbi:MAG TPA: glycosyltransferase family 4 protein [Ardenticatenaceae bacterium]|jgi:glycosyltransferase involved in cell wall biosynthesis